MFRRMVFNILVGNVDGHMRHHARLMRYPSRFVLSPAFDIAPHVDASAAAQSIGVGAYGPANNWENALSQCGRFFLTRDEAGMNMRDIHTLAACFTAAEEVGRMAISIPGGRNRAEAGAQHSQTDGAQPGTSRPTTSSIRLPEAAHAQQSAYCCA
nr:HipA domain-containing protein [Noviherbaspirillum autotrophicum]